MRSFLARHQLGVIVTAVIVAALWLYWPILQLPLSFDDLLHIRLVKGLDYLSVWLPSADFGYYRPFLFLPLLLTRSLFGTYPSPLLYSLNWIFHAVDAALVAWLAWRLWHNRSRALAAGLLFACYPFAYQAVAVFGNNIYPFLAGLILLALHTYLWGLQGKRAAWPITAVLFVVGLLSHELMVLFGVYAALVQWAFGNRFSLPSWRHPRAWLTQSPYLIFLVLGGLYTLLYQFLPTGLEAQASGSDPVWPRVLYFMQALVYPLAWFTNRISTLPTEWIILGGLGFLGLLTLAAARKPENRPALLLGWGWWLATAVLLILTLPTEYILHGARLTYLGSIGVVMVWAVLLAELAARRPWGRLAAAGALLLILLVGSWFVRGRVAALADLGAVVPQLQAVMPSRPLEEGVVLVNLPAWRAPARPTFPVGVELAALMGVHLFAEELVWENLHQVRPVLAVTVPELLRETDYIYGVHDQSPSPLVTTDALPAGAHVFISQFIADGVTATYTGSFSPAAEASSPLARFGDQALLRATAVACPGAITVDLTWEPGGDPSPTVSIFVQALAGDGRLIAQSDGPPLNLRPDQLILPPGWQIHDHRRLDLPPGSRPARLLVGWYDYLSGERFPARTADGTPLPDNALSLPLVACAGG